MFGDKTYHSVYARLYATIGIFYNLGLTGYVEGYCRLNDGAFDWTVGFTSDIPSLGMREDRDPRREKDELMIEI
jgi:hypothetical protein